MYRFVTYGLASYLAPSNLLSAALVGLSAAEVSYLVSTELFSQEMWPAILAAVVVAKTVTGAAYVYKSLF